MSHVSEYEEMDRHAGRCARVALRSSKAPMTIVEICEELRRPIPVSHDDLRDLSLLCERWNIRCNMDDEPDGPWMQARRDTGA